MESACRVYRPRDPRKTALWGLLDTVYERVKGQWEERFERRYGFWRGLADELENTLIVLSADHGAPEAPAYLKSIGIPADYVSPDEWDTDPVVARIKNTFGIEGQMIEGYDHPYLYLTSDIINDPDIDLAALESGNIYVVFNPGCFINDLDGLSVTVVHGSPWRYDTSVPILFAGNGIKPQTVSRRVHTVDVATTLATAVGTQAPTGAAGEVLLEVLGQ